MMSDNYSDILERQWDDIPEPKLLPNGTWLLEGRNVHFVPANAEEQKPGRVTFFYQAVEPMDDVSEDALGELGDGYDYANNDIAKQFTLFRDTDWADVKKHLELHGIDTKGKNQKETFDAFRNTRVLAYLQTKTYKTRAGDMKTDNDPQNFAKVD